MRINLKEKLWALWSLFIHYHFQKDNNRQRRRLTICICILFALIAAMTFMLWIEYDKYALITHRREMLETPEGITEIDPVLIE